MYSVSSSELLPRAPVSALRGHDYKLLKRHCRSHARLTFFSYRVVEQSTKWGGVCSNFHHWILLKEDWTSTGVTIAILWIRACLDSDSQWTANRSLWPNIKGWRRRFQGFKIRFQGYLSNVCTSAVC